MHLKLTSCIVTTFAILAVGLTAMAQSPSATWTFTFFSGDPPVWHTSKTTHATRAECEIARAEKTAAGYPVGECTSSTNASKTTGRPASKPSPPAPTPQTIPPSSDQEREVQARRARKLLEGCLVGCETGAQTCEAGRPTVEQCVQEQNARCIERCTSVENLPHHQCINEVCLPTDINLASWQGLCETQTSREKVTCEAETEQCKLACTTEHPIP